MLALVHSVPRHACDFRCTRCSAWDSTGTSGPAQLEGEGGAYERRVDWLCAACSRLVWGAYIAARRERRALIELSRRLGYPARRADLLRVGGVQLHLFGAP